MKDFAPKFQRMEKGPMEILTLAAFAEKAGRKPSVESELFPFACQVVQKRVKAFNLPIKFTDNALLSITAFVGNNPGRTVALLIDALTKYENKTVTVEMLCELYPWGIYTEESLGDYIDNYLKPKKVKWAEIY